jgi:hypothetical protein
MAMIKVVAMKDIGPVITSARVDKDGRCSTDGRMYAKGDVFEIEEKLFSDYDKTENVRGITFRGSMRRYGAPEPLVVLEPATKAGEAI